MPTPYTYDTPDSQLDLPQKLELIKGIEYWQQERWKRIKRWRALKLPKHLERMFVQNEINLMREQKLRLITLWQEIVN